ncbi:sterol desaturase family protein [Lacibacter sp. H375]|uniref:sterol desaturase family protein n=1 Tax=Lacibacter sp. H375 TaxID=3133424 RepID=UPI0030BCD725
MEFINKLLAINSNYIIIGLMVLFYSLEQLLINQFNFKKRPQHLFQNSLFYFVFFLVNIFWASVTVFSVEWLNKHEIGLFYLVQLPLWLKLLLGVAMIDLVSYGFHRLSHVVPLLWRFHRVHHSDTTMDASTNFRGHPIETFLWFGSSNILAAAVFGLDLLTLGLYFFIASIFFFLEHANFRFPKWLDKSIGLVITTPNIHKVHHDQDQYYTDSNFSDIFILWDRLFGTYKSKPVEQIKLGLKEFDEEKKQTFWYLMKSPFIDVKRIGSAELNKMEQQK